eukprot:TCONS_00019087-protein
MTNGTFVDHIIPPSSYIFFSMGILVAFCCIVGNSLVMVVIVKSSRDSRCSTKMASTWILFHLALSAFFIGVWTVICVVHISTDTMRHNTKMDHARRFFGIVAPGALILILSCISYDRFILLKYHKNHDKHMTKKKTNILIALCWLLPLPVPFLRYLSPPGFYLLVIIAIVVVFVLLIVAYSFVLLLVFNSEKKMKMIKAKNLSLADLTSTEYEQEASPHLQNRRDTKFRDFVSLNRTIKLAKTVSRLLIIYLIFHSPLVGYLLVMLFKRDVFDDRGRQTALLVAELCSQINAALIPFVYFATNQSCRKGIKELCGINK